MIGRLTQRLRNYRSLKNTIGELSKMDDRLLADIGVFRGDIERAVRGGRI